MVKSKSEETKEYKILLETCVPLRPQERVCSSVLLPDRLTVTSGVHIFGSTAQGTEQPGCLCITPFSPAVSLFPPSHHLLHLRLALWGARSAHQTFRKLCFGFGWPRDASWVSTSTRASEMWGAMSSGSPGTFSS